MPIIRTHEGLVRADDVCCRGAGTVQSGPPASSTFWVLSEPNPGSLQIAGGAPGQIANVSNNSNSQREIDDEPLVATRLNSLIQGNFRHRNVNQGGIGLVFRLSSAIPADTAAFIWRWGQAANQWDMFDGLTNPVSGGVGLSPINNVRTARVAVVDQGPNGPGRDLLVEGYVSNIQTGFQSLIQVPTFQASFVDLISFRTPDLFHGGNHQQDSDMAMFSWNDDTIISMAGLPTGWKLRYTPGLTVAVESGGTASIDMRTEIYPGTLVEVLDDLDVVQDSFSPTGALAQIGQTSWPGTVWPGDEYLFSSPIPLAASDLDCVCVEEELAIQLTWVDNSSDEDGFRIERSEVVDFSVFIVVGTTGPDIETFIDDTVEESTRYFYRVIAFNASGEAAPTNLTSCGSRRWTECPDVPPVTAFTVCEVKDVCPPELILVSDAAFFLDNFNRSNRPLEGDNGWFEALTLADWLIVSNQACVQTALNDDNNLLRTIAGTGQLDYIIEADHLTAGTNGFGPSVRYELNDPVLNSEYLFHANDILNQVIIFKRVNGGAFSVLAFLISPVTTPVKIKGVLQASGSDLILEMYLDNVLFHTVTDTSPLASATKYDSLGLRPDNPTCHDNFLFSPRTIQIQNVPTGYSANVDALETGSESGGQILVPMNSIQQPATRLTLFNELGAVADVEEPPGGFHGGAVFNFA